MGKVEHNNGEWGTPIGSEEVTEEDQREINREWMKSKDEQYPGGFTAFCKRYNLNEEEWRKACE